MCNEQMLRYLSLRQVGRERPPEEVSTFRKLCRFLQQMLCDQKGLDPHSPDAAKIVDDELRHLRFEEFTVVRAADGSILLSEPIPFTVVESFLNHRLLLGDTGRTYNQMRQHLISFFDWIGLRPNPAQATLRAQTEPEDVRVALDRVEVDRLINAASRSVRDLSLVMLLLGAGLRAKEVRMVQVTDVDLERKRMFLHQTYRKTRRAHVVPLTAELVDVIAAYLRSADGPLRMGSMYLFPSHDGRMMTYNELRRVLDELCERAGIRKITPHVLRHTCATLYKANGMDVASIAKILGHERISITYRYVHIPMEVLRHELGKSSVVRLVEEELGAS